MGTKEEQEQEWNRNVKGIRTTKEQEQRGKKADRPSDQVTCSAGSWLALRAVISSFRGREQSRIEPSRNPSSLSVPSSLRSAGCCCFLLWPTRPAHHTLLQPLWLAYRGKKLSPDWPVTPSTVTCGGRSKMDGLMEGVGLSPTIDMGAGSPCQEPWSHHWLSMSPSNGKSRRKEEVRGQTFIKVVSNWFFCSQSFFHFIEFDIWIKTVEQE